MIKLEHQNSVWVQDGSWCVQRIAVKPMGYVLMTDTNRLREILQDQIAELDTWYLKSDISQQVIIENIIENLEERFGVLFK